MPRALAALSLAAFGIGCTEFIVMGLLPQMGADLGVSVPTMGMLITAYAVGVVVGAPTLTMIGARLTTRSTLIALMAVFVVGNLASAIAPTFALLVVARVLTSLAHGSFFGVGAIAAVRAMPAGKGAQGIATMFVGLTVANVIGVPLATWIGQHLGWRLVFAGIAFIGLVAIAGIRAWVPADQMRIDLRSEFASFKRPAVWSGLLITTVGFGSLFAVYSYITPILTQRAGLSELGVTGALALFGLGTTAGTLLGGRMGDRWGLPAVGWGLLMSAALLLTFVVTSRAAIPAVLTLTAFGAAGFVLGPILQNHIIRSAGTSGSLVSAANQGAFNVANAIGAALGALVLRQGLGYGAPMLVGAGLALAGAALVGVTVLAGSRIRVLATA